MRKDNLSSNKIRGSINEREHKSTTYVQQQDDPCSFSTNHTGTVIEFHHGYRGYDDD